MTRGLGRQSKIWVYQMHRSQISNAMQLLYCARSQLNKALKRIDLPVTPFAFAILTAPFATSVESPQSQCNAPTFTTRINGSVALLRLHLI